MTYQQYIKRLQSVHISMILGAALLGIVSFFILKPTNGMTQGQSLFVMIGSSTSIFFLMLFALLQKQKIEISSQQKLIKDKLISFQNAYMMILSMLFGPAILNFMLYGLGGPSFNLILGIAFSSLLSTRYISEERLKIWLKFTDKEIKQTSDSKNSVFK